MTTAPPPGSPSSSWGERCLSFLVSEMRRGVRSAPYPEPNTSPRVRDYLRPCVRDLNGDGKVEEHARLGLTVGDWCAAVQCYAMRETQAEGSEPPHLYRAAVVEIVHDAQQKGLWHPVEEFHRGVWSPNRGDLVIWDRRQPGGPEWHRHVNRFEWWTSPEWTHFTTVGGNEGRTIQRQLYLGGGVQHPRLLGFVSYYEKPKPCYISPEERERNLRLIAAAIDEFRREQPRLSS